MVSFLYSFILLWFHSCMASFLYGFIPLWFHSFMFSFFYGFILVWLHSFMVSFLYGFILLCFHSFMVSFSYGFIHAIVMLHYPYGCSLPVIPCSGLKTLCHQISCHVSFITCHFHFSYLTCNILLYIYQMVYSVTFVFFNYMTLSMNLFFFYCLFHFLYRFIFRGKPCQLKQLWK